MAGSGAEALALAAGARYDALVTDMRMPVMGGAELVHEVRRARPGLPAMVVTAHVGDDDLEAARREGLLAVLPKPVPVAGCSSCWSAARRDGAGGWWSRTTSRLSDNLCEALRARGFAAVTAASVLETERLGPVRAVLRAGRPARPGRPDGEAMRRLAERSPGCR